MTSEDLRLAARIRPLMKSLPGYSEKKMFGGLAFMINGNMCVGPWKGSLIVRLDRADHEDTLSEPYVRPMDITGKVMKGWARVLPEGLNTDDDLEAWVARAVAFVETLPKKSSRNTNG